MNKLKILALAGGLAIAGAGGAAAVVAVAPDAAFEAARGGFHQAIHGGHGHRGKPGLHKLCRIDRAEKLEHAFSFVEGMMTFDEPQAAAWAGLTDAIRDGNRDMDAACAGIDGPAETSTEQLAEVELALETGLSAVRKIRPAYDGFYATLNEKQREALDSLGHRRGRGWR